MLFVLFLRQGCENEIALRLTLDLSTFSAFLFISIAAFKNSENPDFTQDP